MTDHILKAAKAYCALIGAVLTALIGATDVPSWVPVVAAVCTAVATYAVPNKTTGPTKRDQATARAIGTEFRKVLHEERRATQVQVHLDGRKIAESLAKHKRGPGLG